MKNLFILLLSLLFIGCCASRKVPTTQEDTKETTTESIQYVVKDTAIYIPGDTVRIETVIPCPDITWQTEAKGSKTTVKARIEKGKLTVECSTDSLTQRIQYLEKQLERKTEVIKTITQVVEKPVTKHKVPRLMWWIVLAETGVLVFMYRKVIWSIARKLLLKF